MKIIKYQYSSNSLKHWRSNMFSISLELKLQSVVMKMTSF